MSATAPKRPWLGLIVLPVVCFAAAGIGGAAVTPKIDNWYATLVKPSWNPPDRVFGPVWSVLYLCMAIAAWLVWRQGGPGGAVGALTLFGVQLVLNLAWPWLFFGLRNPGLAFVDVLLLWAAVAATMAASWSRSTLAGILFAPYLAWVSFAAALNFVVWRMNA